MWEAFAALYAPGTSPPLPADVERAALELRTCRGYGSEALDRESLRAIDVPVCLPVGANSPRRMHEAAALLASVFPRARVERFDGRGHFDLFFASADEAASGVRRCLS